jgi:triphosphatase
MMSSVEKDGTGQETELKLLLMKEIDPDQLWIHPAIAGYLVDAPTAEILSSTYFDTRDYRLLKNGLTYRIRKENKQWIATVKSMGSAAGGLHQREEWNMILPDEKPRPDEFVEEKVQKKLLSLIDDQLLVPLLKTQFKRTKAIWQDLEHNKIEIALDQGEIITTVKNRSISEIELELKHGEDQQLLLKLGAALSEQIPMIPGEISKFERGLELLGLKPAKKRSAETKRLPGKLERKTMDQMVPLILDTAFQDVMKYFYLLNHETDSPEYVHQMRVKIRQMRVLWSFFKPMIQADHYLMMKNELRDLAAQLTPIRELDVMKFHFDQFQNDLELRKNKKYSSDRLQLILDRSLETERGKLKQTLMSGKITPSVLRILQQIQSFDMEADAVSTSLSEFAPRRMNKWMEQFREVSAQMEIYDTAAMHRVRIQVKKIRYVAEWMESMIPRMTDKTINMLKDLQDILGELHDIQCERVRMQEWMTDELPSAILMTQAGIYEGWQQGREYQLKQVLNESWRIVLKKLKGSGTSEIS